MAKAKVRGFLCRISTVTASMRNPETLGLEYQQCDLEIVWGLTRSSLHLEQEEADCDAWGLKAAPFDINLILV
jgi:hypothetical protein